MAALEEVRVGAKTLDRLQSILSPDAFGEALKAAAAMRERLFQRVVWNVNSTAAGGGVAEMLQSLLGYTRGLGVDSRWLVVQGNDPFFRVTKRLHHALHGEPGDGSPLGPDEHEIYEQTLGSAALELRRLARPGDFVLLHDPQTAGLAPALAQTGVHVIWRCHIGSEDPSPEARRGWAFLEPYLKTVPDFVFSREAYVPEFADHGKSTIITPSIDPLSAKNQDLPADDIAAILVHTGLVEGPVPDGGSCSFLRDDGTPGRVSRQVDVVRSGRAPAADTPLVVQVSRWDPLKDMAGVMDGFARLVTAHPELEGELVLAGPDVRSVADDPEGIMVFNDVVERWRALPAAVRDRVHLASLPMDDVQENAIIVNALQRHATVVVQKSLREGFGLTVTEAMWKGRPVVASALGGILDQIEDGVSGVLIADPSDPNQLAEALCAVLQDPERAEAIGACAHERVRERFLGVGHLVHYAQLLQQIDTEGR
ncbi:MAG: glycosyltransferase [Deltaproteobacteria bacterium]|nr:glycosyltransferase [Deltaproteobacteria bacterium]MBW2395405.1 glycosyltransferase [Deltaproteobacteria bacterium]